LELKLHLFLEFFFSNDSGFWDEKQCVLECHFLSFIFAANTCWSVDHQFLPTMLFL
jgi:hypothetical protein